MKVAIIEDHLLVADMLGTLCRRTFNFDVVVQETLGKPALAQIRKHKPGLLLLDLSLPDMDGLDIAEAVLSELPETRILVLSSLHDPVTMHRLQIIGVHGFVDKRTQDIATFKEAIRVVSDGNLFFAPVVHDAAAALRKDPLPFHLTLTDLEQRMLGLIGEAKTDEEISREMRISALTVQSHRRNIMHKVGIHTTPKLIRYAIDQGFTRAEHFPPVPKRGS